MQLTWLPQAGVTLQVLDKVNAQNSILTIKVGQQAKVGSLSIQVQACDTHPADKPGFRRYLTITDSHPDAPGFAAGFWRTTRRRRCCSIRSTTCVLSAARCSE